jgi:hypothetical protein
VVAQVKRLEGRALLTGGAGTYTWNNPSGGDFSTAADWTGPGGVNAVPGSGDDAVIPAGSYTVTVSTAETVNTLAASATLSVVQGGNLTLAGALLNDTNSTINNLSIVSGGTLSGSFGGTALTGSGLLAGTINAAGSSIDFDGTPGGYVLEGGITLSGGIDYEIRSDVDIEGDVNAPIDLVLASGTASAISGSGTLTITTADGSLEWESGLMTGAGGSTVISSGSILVFDFGLITGATFGLDDRGLVNQGGTHLAGPGSLTINGAGGFSNSGNLVADEGNDSFIGTGRFTNTGTLEVDNSYTLSVENLALTSGTVRGTGTLQISSGGTLAFNGTEGIDLDGGPLENYGSATWSGTGTINLQDSASIVNEVGGTFTILSAASLEANTNIFENDGTLIKSGPAGPPDTFLTLTYNQTSTGVTEIQAGGLSFSTLDNQGQILVAAGSSFATIGFTQSSTGLVEFDVGGTPTSANFGSALIYSPASLAGSFVANLVNGYVPTPGQVYQVIMFEQPPTGTFSTITLPKVGGANVFSAGFAPGGFRLTAITPTPSAPTGLTLLPADDTSGPNTTAIRTPRLTGSATANFSIQIYLGSQLVETGVAGSNGTFVTSAVSGFRFAPGTYALTAYAISTTGAYSTASTAYSLTITPPPPAPTGLAIFPADDTSGPGTTTLASPRLTGQTQANLAVQIYELVSGNQRLVAAGTANPNGTFVVSPVVSFAVGNHTLIAVAIDAGGNYGAISPNFLLTILPGLPAAPTALALFPADDTNGPGVTAIHAPRITGSAPSGDAVQIYAGSQLVETGVAGSNGTFVASPVSGQAFLSGTFTLSAYAINGSGVYSPASAPFSLTILPPPVAPTGLSLFPTDDTSGPGQTTVTRPRFIGTSSAGLLIQVYDQTKRMVATGTVGSNGGFQINSVVNFAPGTYSLTAYAIDGGGNYSPASSAYSLTILATTTSPTGLAIDPPDDTAGPGVTAIHAPRLVGNAPAGTAIQIYDQNKRLVATAVTSSAGAFVANSLVSFASGTYTLTAYAINGSGVYSPPSAPFALTIAPPPPAPTSLTLFAADDNDGPGITTVTRPRFTGQAAVGTQIQIYDAAGLVATGVAGSNGTFVATSVITLAPGAYTLMAYAIDAGGDYSAASLPYSLVVR